MDNKHKEIPISLFNLKVIRRGIMLFVLITAIGIALVFVYSNQGLSREVLKSFEPWFLVYGLLFVVVDQLLGGARNHIFVKEFNPDISLWVSIRANLSNIFMGAVTPSQMGGGPAQWYIYHRQGMHVSDAVGISFYNWISTIVFFPLSGALALVVLEDRLPDGLVTHLTTFGFSAFLTLLLVIGIGLFMPNFLRYLLLLMTRILRTVSEPWSQGLRHFGGKAVDQLGQYRSKYLGLILDKPYLMLSSFLITILLYFVKYAFAYFLVGAMGIEVNFWSVVAIQAVVFLLLYFAPSPGGSGIAELSIGTLMSTIIGHGYIALFTLVFRFFTVFIPLLLGAYVVINQITKDGKS